MTKIIPKKKPDGSLPLTPNNLYFTFQQFLVTWINIITKERSIYPEESYEFRNSFNLQCPYNRHPDVTKWNDDLIGDIMDDLCFKKIKLISLIIFDKETEETIERYSLNMFEFLHTPKDYYDKQISGFQDLSWKLVYDEFRANLYSLLNKIRKLPSLTNDVDRKLSYTIVLETQDVALNDNWILDNDGNNDKTDMNINNDNDDNNDNDIKLIPLRNVDIGPILFYSSIEIKQ